jgi:AraC-like DNA-binding protein
MLTPLHLVRARYVLPFAKELDDVGAPTARLLRAAHLDPAVVNCPDGLIAQAHLWRFAALAAKAEREDLGIAAGSIPIQSLGRFGYALLGAATLRQAMVRFCAGAAEEATAHFFISVHDEQAWFCRNRIPGQKDEVAQIEQYLVVLMCNTVAATMGSDWGPAQLRLQTRAPSPLASWRRLEGCRIRYGCTHMGICIPTALLAVGPRRAAGCAPGQLHKRGLNLLDPKDSIRQWLRANLRYGNPTIEALACGMHISARTLQRKLAEQGTTFSAELATARFEVAREILSESPNVRLTDLAYDLGYANPAHFTRAFKRFTGVPPSEFYKQRERADRAL